MSLSRWCYYFIFLLHTCQICYLVSLASESPLVWERAADSVCHVSFLCSTSFPSDIVGGVWNLIVTVPDPCLFLFAKQIFSGQKCVGMKDRQTDKVATLYSPYRGA